MVCLENAPRFMTAVIIVVEDALVAAVALREAVELAAASVLLEGQL